MNDKGMSVGLLCSVIGHTVNFQRENNQGVSEKSPWRERRGIEMKSIGPKEVEPFLNTKELVSAS